jgi:hypothetical protein
MDFARAGDSLIALAQTLQTHVHELKITHNLIVVGFLYKLDVIRE